jgi:hypothetical protein
MLSVDMSVMGVDESGCVWLRMYEVMARWMTAMQMWMYEVIAMRMYEVMMARWMTAMQMYEVMARWMTAMQMWMYEVMARWMTAMRMYEVIAMWM